MESMANLGLFAVNKIVSEYAERIYAYLEKTPRATKLCISVSPAYGFSALALVKCSNEGGPGPRHNMKEDPGTFT